MGVMAEVNATPVWDSATLPLGSGTPDPDKFAEFMKALVGRTTPDGYSYAKTISAYEIWNEPNAVLFSNPVDPVAYAHLLEAVYPIIKGTATTPGLDPTATVVAGALGHVYTVGGYTMDPVEFVQAMLQAGAGGSFDALSYHPYDETAQFSDGNTNAPWASDTAYNQIKDIQALIGNRLVWLSEYGVPTTDGTAAEEAKQAAYIKNLLDTWYALGQAGGNVGPVFLYTGQDDLPVGASTDPNKYFGLWYKSGACTATGCAKDAVAILKKWLIDHPQTTVPTDPTGPTAADWADRSQGRVAGGVAGLRPAGRQCDRSQALNAIVNAISNVLAGPSQAAAPAAAPLTTADGVGGVDGRHHPGRTSGSGGGRYRGGNGQGRRQDRSCGNGNRDGDDRNGRDPGRGRGRPGRHEAGATTPAEATTPGTTGTTTETGTAGTPSGSTASTESPTDGKAGESGDAGKSATPDKPGKDGKSGKDGQTKSGKDGDDGDHEDGSGRHERGGKRGGGSDSEGKVKAEGATAWLPRRLPNRPPVRRARKANPPALHDPGALDVESRAPGSSRGRRRWRWSGLAAPCRGRSTCPAAVRT